MMQKPDQELVYRPSMDGLPNIPLSVRSTGHFRVQKPWGEDSKKKWFAQLFWTVDGRGEFRLGDQTYACGKHTVFMYYPGEEHHLRALSPTWEYYWLTLDHRDCIRWLEGFGFKQRMLQAKGCPQDSFERLAATLRGGTPQGERDAAHLAHAILQNISAETTSPSTHSLAAEAKRHLEDHCLDNQFNIEELANRLHIHRSTLYRVFTRENGITPSRYLHNLRVQQALARLRNSPALIAEIAHQCGFGDANYFSRAIREASGLSPREFRRNNF